MKSMYGLKAIPGKVEMAVSDSRAPGLKYSGNSPIPAIGDRVFISLNKLGHGEVVSYYVEDSCLGVEIKLDSPPNWHVKRYPVSSGNYKITRMFGSEIERFTTQEIREEMRKMSV